jgi:hypothetical protein
MSTQIPTVAERRSRAQSPILASPGYGRTWAPFLVKRTPYSRKGRWVVSLVSRTGALVGYIAEYDTGWGANSLIRGKFKMVGGDGYQSPQAAADALLRARKAKR